MREEFEQSFENDIWNQKLCRRELEAENLMSKGMKCKTQGNGQGEKNIWKNIYERKIKLKV